MDKRKLEKDVFDLAYPVTVEQNVELVGVEFLKEDGEYFLRVYIDKAEGVNIDDCSSVSRQLSDILDEADPIEESYYLEVSSPGPNRLLVRDSDFDKFSGHKIKIKFFKLWENKKFLNGILRGIENNEVLVETDDRLVKIDRSITSFIKLNDE